MLHTKWIVIYIISDTTNLLFNVCYFRDRLLSSRIQNKKANVNLQEFRLIDVAIIDLIFSTIFLITTTLKWDLSSINDIMMPKYFTASEVLVDGCDTLTNRLTKGFLDDPSKSTTVVLLNHLLLFEYVCNGVSLTWFVAKFAYVKARKVKKEDEKKKKKNYKALGLEMINS